MEELRKRLREYFGNRYHVTILYSKRYADSELGDCKFYAELIKSEGGKEDGSDRVDFSLDIAQLIERSIYPTGVWLWDIHRTERHSGLRQVLEDLSCDLMINIDSNLPFGEDPVWRNAYPKYVIGRNGIFTVLSK